MSVELTPVVVHQVKGSKQSNATYSFHDLKILEYKNWCKSLFWLLLTFNNNNKKVTIYYFTAHKIQVSLNRMFLLIPFLLGLSASLFLLSTKNSPFLALDVNFFFLNATKFFIIPYLKLYIS
jgi:hypothetical protein